MLGAKGGIRMIKTTRPSHGRLKLFLAAGAVVVLGGAALAADPTTPSSVQTDWGTFTLSPDIAARVTAKQPLRVVLSMEGPAIPVFGPQYQYGFGVGVKVAEQESGATLDGKFLGPNPPDMNEQINQVRSQAAAGQLDCLSLEGGGAPTWIPIINDLAAKGIPVFTVGEDIDGSHRLGTFHTDWDKEGRMAAKAVVDYFAANKLDLKSLAVASSVPNQPFAQTRMKGFIDEVQKLAPGAVFANNADNAINGTFDPAATYAAMKAFITGHPGVQVIYHTDVNSGVTDKIISDLNQKGSMFAVGHNVSDETLAAIKDGRQIGTIDQNYPAQSQWAASVCAQFLTTGKILPNTNEPILVTAANVDDSLANLKKTTGR
jgi:ABC-type sugar transport system substrate-binding protein